MQLLSGIPANRDVIAIDPPLTNSVSLNLMSPFPLVLLTSPSIAGVLSLSYILNHVAFPVSTTRTCVMGFA